MAASLSINAMQVNFESVLAMEHNGMVIMFKSLEETRLKGCLDVSGSVFQGSVIEFFANAKVIAGTIVSFVANRKLVVTKDVFAEEFGLQQSEKFDLMVAIRASLKVNWAQFLFQILITMVHTPTRQSQAGESIKKTEDTASGTEGWQSQMTKPMENDEAKVVEKKKKKKEKVVSVVKKPVVVVKKPVEARSQATPANSKSETSSDTDSRPLAKLGAAKKGQAAPKAKTSFGLIRFGVYGLDASTAADQEEHVEFNETVEARNVDKEQSIVVRSDPDQSAQQSITSTGKGIFSPIEIREIKWVAPFLPKIDPASKGKDILKAYAFPDPVELHCLLVLNSAYEDVSSQMPEYDKLAHFQTEIRLNTVMSMTSIAQLAKIEDQFLLWAEIEFVSDLLDRRMLVLYKIYEMEVRKRVDEHRANFNPVEPSANYDHMCIRFLDSELKLL
ncbi:hypothetical protein F511_30345 [Dorcoceras hygrometricum]|uniref:Uncharacterized protein n=1 Tax=Dorcoceras hygrometricum TaxID=472368 RepID=A0A2Z7D6W3_9LAMI|nr:hypothetical protein F511_30345 [Dorcoceras hygrometricum]